MVARLKLRRSPRVIARGLARERRRPGHKRMLAGLHPENIIGGMRQRRRPQTFRPGSGRAHRVRFRDPLGTPRHGLEPSGVARFVANIVMGHNRNIDFARADALLRRNRLAPRRGDEVWHHHHEVRADARGQLHNQLHLMPQDQHGVRHYGGRHVGQQMVDARRGHWG